MSATVYEQKGTLLSLSLFLSFSLSFFSLFIFHNVTLARLAYHCICTRYSYFAECFQWKSRQRWFNYGANLTGFCPKKTADRVTTYMSLFVNTIRNVTHVRMNVYESPLQSPTQTRHHLCRKQSMKKVKNVYTCTYRKKRNKYSTWDIYVHAARFTRWETWAGVAMRFTRPDPTRPGLKIFRIVRHSTSGC